MSQSKNVHAWYFGNKISYDSDEYFPENQVVGVNEEYVLVQGPSLVWYTNTEGDFVMTKNMYMVPSGESKKFLKPLNQNVRAKVAPFIEDGHLSWTELSFSTHGEFVDRNRKKTKKIENSNDFHVYNAMLHFPVPNTDEMIPLETYVYIQNDTQDPNKRNIKKLYGFSMFPYAINIKLHQIPMNMQVPVQILNKNDNETLHTSAHVQILRMVPDEEARTWEEYKIPEKRKFTGKKLQAFKENEFCIAKYTIISGTRVPNKEVKRYPNAIGNEAHGLMNVDDGVVNNVIDDDDENYDDIEEFDYSIYHVNFNHYDDNDTSPFLLNDFKRLTFSELDHYFNSQMRYDDKITYKDKIVFFRDKNAFKNIDTKFFGINMLQGFPSSSKLVYIGYIPYLDKIIVGITTRNGDTHLRMFTIGFDDYREEVQHRIILPDMKPYTGKPYNVLYNKIHKKFSFIIDILKRPYTD